MTKTRRILAAGIAAALIAGGGGAAAWWWTLQRAPAPGVAEVPVTHDEPKYVSLEKVIVMLRREPTDSMSHYMAVDLVFKTGGKDEKTTREHLPLLRSVAVRALSTLHAAQARSISVDSLAAQLAGAYAESYAAEGRSRPFSDVMIGKLIVE